MNGHTLFRISPTDSKVSTTSGTQRLFSVTYLSEKQVLPRIFIAWGKLKISRRKRKKETSVVNWKNFAVGVGKY